MASLHHHYWSGSGLSYIFYICCPLLKLFPDVECDKFPNYPSEWTKLARQYSALCFGWSFPCCHSRLVSYVQAQTTRLGALGPLAIFWLSFLHDRLTICQLFPCARPQSPLQCCNLLLCHWLRRGLSLLWIELR